MSEKNKKILKIRFKDKNGNYFPEWKKVKLGDVGEIITGKTPNTNKKELWGGSIKFVTPTDINNNKYQYYSERKINELNNFKILPEGSIMFTCIASIGKMSISKGDTVTNQQINSIIPYENYNGEFLYYSLLKMTEKIKSTQSNTTLPIINKYTFSNFKISLPCLEEQQKIADFLSEIDKSIELKEKELEKLKEYKKGIMQQIFNSQVERERERES